MGPIHCSTVRQCWEPTPPIPPETLPQVALWDIMALLMNNTVAIVQWIFRAAVAVIVVDAVASWFLKPNQLPRSITRPITEPIYAPIRAFLKPSWLGGIDLAPLVVILLLQGAAWLLLRMLSK